MIQPKNSRRVRPDMPHYGVMPDQKDGMLTWDWVDRQMTQSRNYWIATTQPDGRPHVVPIWGAWVEGSFYFGTDKLSLRRAIFAVTIASSSIAKAATIRSSLKAVWSKRKFQWTCRRRSTMPLCRSTS